MATTALRSVGFQLRTDGKAEVKNDFAEVRAAGTQAMTAIADSAEAAGDRAAKAANDAADRQIASWQKAAASAKVAAAAQTANGGFDAALAGRGNAGQYATVDLSRTTSAQYARRKADIVAAFAGLEEAERTAAQAASEAEAIALKAAAAEKQMEDRARALKAAIDPAWAAQQRFNHEMTDARELVGAGAISLDDYCAKLRSERALLDGATEAARRHGKAANDNKAAYAALGPQVQDAFTQISMGANPLNVLAVQGGQAAGQMLYMGGKMQAVAEFMLGPWGLALTGGMLLLGGLIDHLRKTGDETDKTTTAQYHQIGTVEALTEAQKVLDQALGQSLKTQGQIRAEAIGNANANLAAAEAARQRAIQEIALARALLEQEKARSRQGNTRSDLAAMRVPGMIDDLDAREAKLANLEARVASTKVSRDRLVLEDAQLRANDTADRLDNEAKLAAAAGHTGEAQRNLDRIRQNGRLEIAKGTLSEEAYKNQVIAAEKALEAARDADQKHGNGRAQSLARQASAMGVNATSTLALARAYLTNSDAALVAEAARKGLTDATRRGIDGDAQVARQLQVMVAEQVANGAKSVAQLEDEADARRAVLAQVTAGTLPIEGMNQALADEAALRPLLKLQTVAQGDALKVLTEVIDRYRTALADAHAQERSMAFETALSRSVEQVEELKAQLGDLGHNALDSALNAAGRAANREADSLRLAPGSEERTRFVRQKEREAEQDYQTKRARLVADALRDQADQLEFSQRELALAGASDAVRSTELDKLRLEQTIRRQFPDMARDQIDILLNGVEAQAAVNAQLKVTAAAMEEVRGFGTDFVDQVLSEDTWSSWSNAGKTATNLIREEFLKLALINPIKNLINGNSVLPTLTSALGALTGGGLAGKSAALLPSIQKGANLALSRALPGNAIGSSSWSGGLTWVNEQGPEIADLPNGTRIYPAAETRRMLAGNDNGGGRGAGTVIVHADGAVLADNVRGWVAEGVQVAATHGAAGGAQIGEVQAIKRQARQLGRWRGR